MLPFQPPAVRYRPTFVFTFGRLSFVSMIGNIHPNADDWPFVVVEGYEETATKLVQTISGDGVGFAPIVKPSELQDFETFAYDAYENILGYDPNTTAISSFGKGVWAKDITGEFNIEAKGTTKNFTKVMIISFK